MNKSNQMEIHETVIRDIVDAAQYIADKGISIKISPNQSIKNIAKKSSGLTLVFPVIADESVSIDESRMICKAIERKCVVMLQMLFSAIQLDDSDTVKNAFDYIKQFHTNMDDSEDYKVDIDTFMDTMDKMSENSSLGVHITDRALFEAIKEDMKNINYHLSESINPSLNSFKIDSSNADGIIVTSIKEEDSPYGAVSNGLNDNGAAEFDKQISTDVKKANELVPTMMLIKFYRVDKGTSIPIPMTAVIGIKAKLQYVTTSDMINRIVLKNKDKNGLFNFLKATTREVSFWKDFVFALDRAKIDAISSSGRGSSNKIWKMLERRSLKSRINRFSGLLNDASAITTLVISKETAETLKKEHQLNVLNPGTILPIMDSYNIMGFVVVDGINERAGFLFDDASKAYEVISFTHLEREENTNYKKVINLLAKSK